MAWRKHQAEVISICEEIIDGKKKFVHTESLKRRKILWMKIYLHIGRKCELKEMTYEEMNKALELIKVLTE